MWSARQAGSPSCLTKLAHNAATGWDLLYLVKLIYLFEIVYQIRTLDHKADVASFPRV